MVTNQTHTCRWCHQKWDHPLGMFCPHCHRFQDTPNDKRVELFTADMVMDEETHHKLANPAYDMVGEAHLVVHYAGQIRFRFYLNDGKFVYSTSDAGWDHKIEAMSGHHVARISTTHELEEYKYERDGIDRKAIIMHAFEHLMLALDNPGQYLNGMYQKEIHLDQDVVKIYMFPRWVRKVEK